MISTRSNIMNNEEIQKSGIAALKETLGVTGALKFLEQFVIMAVTVITRQRSI